MFLSTGSPISTNSSSSVALAARTNTLGVGFSGGGFLIFYFTGVTAILRQLGIFNNSTRLAGSSSGAINAVQVCSNRSPQQALDDNLMLVNICRPQQNCQGFLDQALTKTVTARIQPNAGPSCSGRLWVSITAAKPNPQPDPNMLQTQWSSTHQLRTALRLSSFLPGYSAPSATMWLQDLPAVGAAYDGGFSQSLPCPPGVRYCVKVTADALSPEASDAITTATLQKVNDMLNTQAALNDLSTGQFVPLNPVVTPTPAADIHPGLSQPLPVNATTWRSWGLNVPDNATIKLIYETGRKDAAYWARQQGLASSSDVATALQHTEVQIHTHRQ